MEPIINFVLGVINSLIIGLITNLFLRQNKKPLFLVAIEKVALSLILK